MIVAPCVNSPPPKYGPKSADHPSVGRQCPACWQPMLPGSMTTLVPIGPGVVVSQRALAREGRPHVRQTVEAHWGCVTGKSDGED